MGQTTGLVALPLLTAVRRHGFWVRFAIAPPVIGVTRPPLSRAIQANLAVFGICLEALAMLLRAAPPLTVGLTTNSLLWPVGRGLKWLLAVAAVASGRQRPALLCLPISTAEEW